MQIKTYPDGGKYVINNNNESSLVYRINSYEDLFLLKSVKDSNPNLKEILIPCMFQQQHDKRFNKNESFELKLVCDFINSCNFEKVKVFHPHSDVTPALLNNCEVIPNTKFIQEVLSDLVSKPEYDFDSKALESNLVLMSSDANGFKSLMKLCDSLEWEGETYSASKSRKYENGKSVLTQILDKEDFNGKDVLIVDDICVYGGTFVGLAKMLKQKNIGKLYLAVSHITVENPTNDLWKSFDTVYTTNSKGLDYYEGLAPFQTTPVTNLKIVSLYESSVNDRWLQNQPS